MSDFQRIDPNQANNLLLDGAQLADIRDPQSYQQGHIPGAVRLDNDNLAQFVEAADKQQPLLICCYHGNSSQSAAAYLASLGFSAVYSLDGGFELWQQHFPDQVSRD
ncbi:MULTISPECIES: thiosulfate sulfurtransferase GlpE [Pseudomonas]|uniref:Thiosulfate sulfurtransferase GlpE n=1 Tax=Pseudomonas neustonica TaxID=2487346 RepID=A0ABX9XNH1_9PSED|nr:MULTISPECIES: thiosulfate sulfurtransferase GlpE [Pseudomonas]MAB23638.1 thiosulfate sulfurtransferase GlpE [Pseudomonadales bacterium]MBA6418467.1 thiosulfate sulfurtransferase GlpE [Pseudomonas sp. 5Ae-yellow]ROZ85732.1 thiosulfate sulfurtransferase GlpE [Pseudomonas sp. SSM44]ROZ87376.1 thiosulfate sulfurtransferase GlpE [Pseudomonas neustonica]|tara:strand:+ start:596 stop:916 length:321 start_codon:yes stop_codon:yes gene_type:complete